MKHVTEPEWLCDCEGCLRIIEENERQVQLLEKFWEEMKQEDTSNVIFVDFLNRKRIK